MSKSIDAHLLREFQVGELMGSGAYGHVWRVQTKNGEKWALKKVFGAFRNRTDAQRTYRQVEVLRQVKHPNIIRLQRVIAAKNQEDLYLLFELMEADLLAVVGSSILSQHHQKYVLQQLISAVHHLHHLQLIHRDLKPSNVLLDSSCLVKLCDFGLVRSLNAVEEDSQILSEEVATKWYRAPELLLGSRSYGFPVDMWSVGCIAAELLTGKTLFSGSSTLEQLEKIIELTGMVGKEDLQALDSPVAECLISQINPRVRLFSDYFSLVDPAFLPLLRGLLQFNPLKRLSASECLQLDLFTQFSQLNEEISLDPVRLRLDDNCRFKVSDYRREIYALLPKHQPSAKHQLAKHKSLTKLEHSTAPKQPFKQKSVSQSKLAHPQRKIKIEKVSGSPHKKKSLKDMRFSSPSRPSSKAKDKNPYERCAKQMAVMLKKEWGSVAHLHNRQPLKKVGNAAVMSKFTKK